MPGVQETSRAAFADVRTTLTQRQHKVLLSLARFVIWRGFYPTAYELFEYLKAQQQVTDLNDVRPRLTELKDLGRVESPGKRQCSVTHKKAMVWRVVQVPLF